MKARVQEGVGARAGQTGFQLGLYDPDPDFSEVYAVGRVYQNSAEERRIMQLAIKDYNESAAKNRRRSLCIGIFQAVG
jgi:hypothetical protein